MPDTVKSPSSRLHDGLSKTPIPTKAASFTMVGISYLVKNEEEEWRALKKGTRPGEEVRLKELKKEGEDCRRRTTEREAHITLGTS